MNYWQKRIIDIQQEISEATEAQVNKELAKLYQMAAVRLRNDIYELYDKINKPDNEILINDFYLNNNYYRFLNKVNQNLVELGKQEIVITDEYLVKMYGRTKAAVSSSLGFQPQLTNAKQVVNALWCKDQKHWSERIWSNKSDMYAKLEQGLVDCVERGLSKNKVISELRAVTGSSYSNAERLVRTELTHVQNEAAAESYKEAGVEQYEYLCRTGNLIPDECDELDGQIFDWSEKEIGINFPPMHPNCRCTILPVIN